MWYLYGSKIPRSGAMFRACRGITGAREEEVARMLPRPEPRDLMLALKSTYPTPGTHGPTPAWGN